MKNEKVSVMRAILIVVVLAFVACGDDSGGSKKDEGSVGDDCGARPRGGATLVFTKTSGECVDLPDAPLRRVWGEDADGGCYDIVPFDPCTLDFGCLIYAEEEGGNEFTIRVSIKHPKGASPSGTASVVVTEPGNATPICESDYTVAIE